MAAVMKKLLFTLIHDVLSAPLNAFYATARWLNQGIMIFLLLSIWLHLLIVWSFPATSLSLGKPSEGVSSFKVTLSGAVKGVPSQMEAPNEVETIESEVLDDVSSEPALLPFPALLPEAALLPSPKLALAPELLQYPAVEPIKPKSIKPKSIKPKPIKPKPIKPKPIKPKPVKPKPVKPELSQAELDSIEPLFGEDMPAYIARRKRAEFAKQADEMDQKILEAVKRKAALAQHQAQRTVPQPIMSEEKQRAARIEANLPPFVRSNVFDVLWLSEQSGQLRFKGWGADEKTPLFEVFDVSARGGDDIKGAVIMQMVDVLRQKFGHEDVVWQSRFGRDIKLSLRIEDTASLTRFLWREVIWPPNNQFDY